MTNLDYAQLAEREGENACDPPLYASSPNGMAFAIGLWAREREIPVYTLRQSRGYTWIMNDQFRITCKGDKPALIGGGEVAFGTLYGLDANGRDYRRAK